MPQLPKRTAKTTREDAYWSRLLAIRSDPLPRTLTVARSSMPSTARWRGALDQATRLLCTVREEMETYSDERSERWHEGTAAEAFHERLEHLDELQMQLDDLRSAF